MNSTPDPIEDDCKCFEFVNHGDAIVGQLPFFPEEFRLASFPKFLAPANRVFDRILNNRKNRK